LRLFGDLLHPCIKQSKHSRRLAWAIEGDIVHDLFQVNRNARG
jgi:hypothetical protein